jgi:uridine phosphorylase
MAGGRVYVSSAAVSSASAPVHLRPTAPVAARALLPGDPGRALALAQALLGDDRRMSNHHRGLWGYTGTALDGEALTIQSTGIGGPSAAVVLEELAALGVSVALRLGTCRALDDELRVGALLAVTEVLSADGTSRALGAPPRRALDAGLTAALAESADRAGPVVSTDLFYDADGAAGAAWRTEGALARDLQTAALAAVARLRGLRFGALLAVVTTERERLDGEAIDAIAAALGARAAAALSACA